MKNYLYRLANFNFGSNWRELVTAGSRDDPYTVGSHRPTINCKKGKPKPRRKNTKLAGHREDETPSQYLAAAAVTAPCHCCRRHKPLLPSPFSFAVTLHLQYRRSMRGECFTLVGCFSFRAFLVLGQFFTFFF